MHEGSFSLKIKTLQFAMFKTCFSDTTHPDRDKHYV